MYQKLFVFRLFFFYFIMTQKTKPLKQNSALKISKTKFVI